MTSATTTTRGVADRLLRALDDALGVAVPIRLRGWDGSSAGPHDGPVVVLRSPRAAHHLMWRPGELGLARAYVSGDLDVDGDLTEALSHVRRALGPSRLRPSRLPKLVVALRAVIGTAGLAPPPGRPAEEARLRGRLHSPLRDRAAISHHYDLGNDFYELLLDDTMAYSSGYWAGLDDDTVGNGAAAQHAKLDLICRKLGLKPGMHLVDVGCGWGSLVRHAARHHGVRVTGFTISTEQGAYAVDRVRRDGLTDLVDIRVQDYREIDIDDADAVASIEMGEHVGEANYPGYAAVLHRTLRPGGRLLLQQMSRGSKAAGGGAFIESYIAPDMHMRPLPETLRMIVDAGFEVRDVESLREHYVRTVAAWARTLEQRWAEVVALAGERTARVWRLYLAGGGLAFAENRMGVDQILAVRTHPDGSSGLPFDRSWMESHR